MGPCDNYLFTFTGTSAAFSAGDVLAVETGLKYPYRAFSSSLPSLYSTLKAVYQSCIESADLRQTLLLLSVYPLFIVLVWRHTQDQFPWIDLLVGRPCSGTLPSVLVFAAVAPRQVENVKISFLLKGDWKEIEFSAETVSKLLTLPPR